MNKFELDFPIVFDGAMGTYYRTKSKLALPACEMGNIFDKDTVLSIHKEYLQSGCKGIKTNTFGANKRYLNCNDDTLEQIINSGCDIAMEAVDGQNTYVFADIGPIVENIEEGILEEYKKIIDLFIAKGLKYFLFETFSRDLYLKELTEYIKSQVPDSYIITSFAINPDGFTRSGDRGITLLENMNALESVDAAGLNCIAGPFHLLEYIKSIKLPAKTMFISPNAGYPSVINNRTYYSNSPSYFGNTVADFIDYGFTILGGCCGTTPEYISRLSTTVESRQTQEVRITSKKPSERLKSDVADNMILKKINSGEKIICVEYDPPASIEISEYMKNVKKLKEGGADAITIADCPVGRARVDSSLMAYKVKNEIGIDPIVHLTCRDRNLNATKALLLGLNVEDILNLIIVTGDPIPTAEKDEIKSVFNFNSALLTKYIDELNQDLFTNKMNVAGALNINSPNFRLELKRAMKKEAHGANMFFTQPCLSEQAVENIKIAKNYLDGKIMGGIMPIVSHRNAVFMDEEISGITVDDYIIEEYKTLSKEEASKRAVSLSLEFMEKIEDSIDGFYLITPFNRVDIIGEIIKKRKNRD